MQTTHTPGPWAVDLHLITTADGETLVAKASTDGSLALVEANARLIAAAPDMLAALYEIANYDPTKWDAATLGNIARAAIARATGED